MLLNHLNIAQLVLLTFVFYQVVSQAFNAGVMHLIPKASNSFYTLTNITQQRDVILTISSFDAIRKSTSCSIIQREESSIYFKCTENIQSVAYLYYDKTPLVYSNVFHYYFLPNDQRTTVTWYPPINLTIINYPTLRAMLTGFTLREENYALVQLSSNSNNTAIIMNRTTNLKKVSFSFIMIQNYGIYNLSFLQLTFSHYKMMAYQTQKINALNFWGISSLKFQKTAEDDQVFFSNQELDSSQDILFVSSHNILVSSIFLISNENRSASCQKYYNPFLRECQNNCSSKNTLTWNTSQSMNNYCMDFSLRQLTIKNTYINNNSKEILETYAKNNDCSDPIVDQDGDIICLSCKDDFMSYEGKCVCRYGLIKNQSNCRKCEQGECQLKQQTSYAIQNVDISKANILFSVYLDTQMIQQQSSRYYQQNLTVNGRLQSVGILFNSSLQSLNFVIYNVSKQNKYEINFQGPKNSHQESLFYVFKSLGNPSNKTLEFLWTLSLNLIIDSNLSSQSLLKTTVSPIIQHSDKAVPFVFVVGFLIGDKINAMSFFQTLSYIYLVKFIELEQSYDALKDLISHLFVLHPKTFYEFINFDRTFGEYRFKNEIKENKFVYQQTQGYMLLGLGINKLLCLLLQILGISCISAMTKKFLQESSNKVFPTQNMPSAIIKTSKKSKTDQTGTLIWLDQPSSDKQNIKMKLFNFLDRLDSKKYVNFTALILTHHLYFTLLSLNELTLPLTDIQAIVSRIFTSIILLLILIYPILLINQEPLYLLKSISILKKRYAYKKRQIWLYFYLYYNQPIIYGIIVFLLSNSIAKISIIICLQLAKLIYFRKMLKKIEIIKIVTILLFFMSIMLNLTLPIVYSSILIQITVITILTVVLCQVLKLIRGLIILTLNLFKGEQKQEKNQQIVQTSKKQQKNLVLNHFQSKYRNQKLIKNKSTHRHQKKGNFHQDYNKQNIIHNDQLREELEIKRPKKIDSRQRNILKNKN